MKSEKWEKIRQKGKKRYVIEYGVLGWGVTTAIIWSIAMELMIPSDELWARPLIALVLFPVGGIGFGLLTWYLAEKEYAKWSGLEE